MLLSVRRMRNVVLTDVVLLTFAAIAAYVALALQHWSRVKSTYTTAEGDQVSVMVYLGLWSLCATVQVDSADVEQICTDGFLQQSDCRNLYRAAQIVAVVGAVTATLSAVVACTTVLRLKKSSNYILRAALSLTSFIAFVTLLLTWLLWLLLAESELCGAFRSYAASFWIEVASSVASLLGFILGLAACFLTAHDKAFVQSRRPSASPILPILKTPPGFPYPGDVPPPLARTNGVSPALSPMLSEAAEEELAVRSQAASRQPSRAVTPTAGRSRSVTPRAGHSRGIALQSQQQQPIAATTSRPGRSRSATPNARTVTESADGVPKSRTSRPTTPRAVGGSHTGTQRAGSSRPATPRLPPAPRPATPGTGQTSTFYQPPLPYPEQSVMPTPSLPPRPLVAPALILGDQPVFEAGPGLRDLPYPVATNGPYPHLARSQPYVMYNNGAVAAPAPYVNTAYHSSFNYSYATAPVIDRPYQLPPQQSLAPQDSWF